MKALIHGSFWWFVNHTYMWWPDALWLKMIYKQKMHQTLNLRNPTLFTEKLQWLKLHDRKPIYSSLVDKYEAKKYISTHYGENLVIPNYGVWNHFSDINFDELPEQFVLKCTHDSGRVFICKDKRTFDKTTAAEVLEKSLRHNFYYWTREWPYKRVKPRIIAEKFMSEQAAADLVDYKFYCFNGRASYCQVITNRSVSEAIDFYDRDWQLQPFIGLNPQAHHAASVMKCPEAYDQMLSLADDISTRVGSPFLRVDLYYIGHRIYFGEITFYPGGGTGVFTPPEWNRKLGDMIKL